MAAQTCKGVRGAVCAESNTSEAILEAAEQLLSALIQANGIAAEEVASVFFTVSPDITAAYPATAAHRIGFSDVAMLCAQELAVPTGPALCIRVLIHWNTTREASQIEHIYMGEASTLRPDRRWPRDG